MRLHAFLFLMLPATLFAWGTEGHRIVGVEALDLMDDTARSRVIEILGGDSTRLVSKACSWPDTVRKTPDWEWSAPLHFVNIPRQARHYDRQRDCSDGMCVTEAIAKYANQLTLPGLASERRWQAFAWLCHLVGDLHQPLHAGYRDDRGGNSVNIVYQGQPHNLHEFWDSVVIRERLQDGDSWIKLYSGPEWEPAPGQWAPPEVVTWTDHSHQLVATSAYPPGPVIDAVFADHSWLIIRQQLQKASLRLAQIVNAVIGEGEVLTGERSDEARDPGRF